MKKDFFNLGFLFLSAFAVSSDVCQGMGRDNLPSGQGARNATAARMTQASSGNNPPPISASEEAELIAKQQKLLDLYKERYEKTRAERAAKLQADKNIKAEQEAKLKAEQEAKLKVEQESKAQAAKLKAEQEAKLKAEQEAKAQALKLKAEQDSKAQEAKLKADQEAKLKAEQEAKLKELAKQMGVNLDQAKIIAKDYDAKAKEKERAGTSIYLVYNDQDTLQEGKSIGAYQVIETSGDGNDCLFYSLYGSEEGRGVLRAIMGSEWRPKKYSNGSDSMQDVRAKFFQDIRGNLEKPIASNNYFKVKGLLSSMESYNEMARTRAFHGLSEGNAYNKFLDLLLNGKRFLDINFVEIFNALYEGLPGFKPVAAVTKILPSGANEEEVKKIASEAQALIVKTGVAYGDAIFIHHDNRGHYSTMRKLG